LPFRNFAIVNNIVIVLEVVSKIGEIGFGGAGIPACVLDTERLDPKSGSLYRYVASVSPSGETPNIFASGPGIIILDR